MAESSQTFPSPPTPPPAPFPQLGGGGDLHLLDRLGVLHKYHRLIVSIVTLVFLAGVVQTYTTTPLFQAAAKIQIDHEKSNVAEFRNPDYSYLDPEEYRQTQFRILRSRELARRVIEKLNLADDPVFMQKRAGSGGLLATVRDGRERAIGAVKGYFVRAEGQPPAERPSPMPNRQPERPDESGLIDRLLAGVEVEPVRNTRLVDVHFTSHDPQFAARVANALAHEYIEQNLQIRQEEQRQALTFLQQELVRQDQQMKEAEQKLNEFRQRQGTVGGEGQDVVVSRLNDLQVRVANAEGTRTQREALFNQLKELGPKAVEQADRFPVIATNVRIQALRTEQLRLQREKLRLSERYGPNWPAVKTIESELQEAQADLVREVAKVIEEVRNEYDLARRQEAALRGQFEQAKQAARDLNQKSIGVSTLENQVKVNRDLQQHLAQRQRELQISSQSTENNVRLVDRAEVPKAPFTPQVQRNLLLALAIGLVLGVGLALGLDYIDDTIKTPEDITNRLRIPFLGLVPAIRGDRTPLLSQTVPHDFGEAFRALRTALVFTSGATGTRLIAVTSAQPLEGKTTTACNLAIALSLGGARVLLIDADMRRPGVHLTLGITNEVGLSHLLTGQARVREVIQRTDDPNLLVATAGRTPPNPSELLASPRMKGLIENLATGPFDWVIIDTPPVLAVTDAVILTPLVSGVVFVLGAEMTRRRLAERAIQMLTASKPQVFGAVLNRVNLERNRYYYSRYYGYQYKSYYGQAASA